MVMIWIPQRTQHPSGESSNAWRGWLHTEERRLRKEAGNHWPAVGPHGTGAQKGHGALLSTMPPETQWILSFPVEGSSRCFTWQVPTFPALVPSMLSSALRQRDTWGKNLLG